jgi:hypothetical protein
MKEQHDVIYTYINKNNIIYRIEESNILKNVHSFDRKIDQVIDSMKEFDCLTISHLNFLGNSVHRILKRLHTVYNKNCRLDVILGNIHIDPRDISDGVNLILDMFKISNDLNRQKKEAVKKTLKLSGKKTGRVSGKTYKSKFDQYRTKIMTMHSKCISKKKICETIGIGTPQAIGKYIKAINEQKEQKKMIQNKNTTYISTKMIDTKKLSGQIGFENIYQD